MMLTPKAPRCGLQAWLRAPASAHPGLRRLQVRFVRHIDGVKFVHHASIGSSVFVGWLQAAAGMQKTLKTFLDVWR